jgi:hypothetical protein
MRNPRLLAAAALLCAGVAAVAIPSAASAAPAHPVAAPASHVVAVGGTSTPAWAHEARPGMPQQYAVSTNWSGYVNTGSFGAVHGTWVVPTPTCSGTNTFSAFWVGLNGWTNTTVQQLGISADCTSSGPDYFAWTEMYPAPSNPLSETAYPVRPGDTITASVLTNIGVFALQMSSSRGWSFFFNASGPTTIVFAEWIAEAPTGVYLVLPLADFGTVSFTNCTTNNTTPISANPTVPITMQLTKRMPSGETGTLVEAEPSALNAAGTGFTVKAFPYGHRYQL